VAGDTNETTRDILQLTLLGKTAWSGNTKTFDGSGIIPRECIGKVTWKQGVPDLADTVYIKHITGRWAALGFKSYDQGRRVFQGTAKQGIWLDEECPMDVYNESIVRLATTGGLMMLTYTPLLGMSDVTLSFLGEDF
jgi:phage terminase large subunit-like protein